MKLTRRSWFARLMAMFGVKSEPKSTVLTITAVDYENKIIYLE